MNNGFCSTTIFHPFSRRIHEEFIIFSRIVLYKTDERHCEKTKYVKEFEKRPPVAEDPRVCAFFCLCSHVGTTK
jgi:hypothetical protein